MKFSEMTYTRPDPAASKQRLSALTAELKAAKSYEEARKVFLSQQELMSHISTAATLASIRHSIDTRDKFYDGEEKFWNNFNPELEEYNQAWTAAMLESPFRADFEKEYGDLMFVNAEIGRKAFSPAIVEELKQENQLVQDYQKLIAGAQIDFEGSTYTISQLSPFKTCADDEKRLAAWKAEGQWYKDNQAKFDELYDKLVKLRDAMGKKLGYEGYTTLGYYRMGRNCYGKADVEKFRAAVAKAAGVAEDAIVTGDLFLYDPQKGVTLGEYISAPRLDDLQCAFSSLTAFLAAGESRSIPVCCIFDNEEVGSETKQGAASTFLYDTLTRLCAALSSLSAARDGSVPISPRIRAAERFSTKSSASFSTWMTAASPVGPMALHSSSHLWGSFFHSLKSIPNALSFSGPRSKNLNREEGTSQSAFFNSSVT